MPDTLRPQGTFTPDIEIDATGGNVYLDSPQQGLNTVGLFAPVTFRYLPVEFGENDFPSYNRTKWTIQGFTSGGNVIYETSTRVGAMGSIPSKFILTAGIGGLNIQEINDYVEANTLGGIFQTKITCTVSMVDDEGTTLVQKEAYFLLDAQFDTAANKTNADINEEGNFADADSFGFEDVETNYPDSLLPLPDGIPNFVPFKATIISYGNEGGVQYLQIDESWDEYKSQLPPKARENVGFSPENNFLNYNFTYKSNDREDLNTYLHFGDDKIYLTTNVVTDAFTYPRPPHAAVFKMYEPLPAEINEKDKVYIVKEILPLLTETVELVSYDPEDDVNDVVDIVVLRTADNLP